MGQETRRHHQMRIGGVSAARYRRDDYVAIGEALHSRFRIIRKGSCERLRDGGESDLLLRPTRSGDKRFYGRKIDRQSITECWCFDIIAPQAGGLCMTLYVLHQHQISSCLAQVAKSFATDAKKPVGCTILWLHVCDCRPVAKRQVIQAIAVQLHELSDYAMLAKRADDGQNNVSCRCSCAGSTD